MLTYKNLIRTFEMFAAHDGGLEKECIRMWAEHDEHGISAGKLTKFSLEEIRELADMGWHFGCDDDYDGDDRPLTELSDDELMEKWNNNPGVYTYE